MTSPLAFSLFDGQPEWAEVAVILGLAFLVATLVATVTGRLVRLVLSAIYGDADRSSQLVARPVFITRLVTFALALPVTALPMLDATGERFDVGLDQKSVLQWFFASGLRIAIIVTLAWLVIRVVVSATNRLEQEMARGSVPGTTERLKRAQKLGALVENVAVTLIGGVALLMVLRELNVDVLPMLTGAGIAGVALGFGAQFLVRDLIAGFFLILEDQVRVGDVAVVNGQGGLVEEVNLRTIVLRDEEGTVHVFPNGEVKTLANKSKDFSYYVITFGVGYDDDPERVMAAMREAAASLEADPEFKPHILEPLEVYGIDAFQDTQLVVKARIKTVPLKQWLVGRELRRRIAKVFHERGIAPPSGRMIVTLDKKED